MSYSFNLIDKPWIPCVQIRGGVLKQLSLRELLSNSDQYSDIQATSPLETVAIMRLLFAIIFRALSPVRFEKIKQFFSDGFPEKEVNTYLNKWHDRFDLFHQEHPFYQVTNMQLETKAISTVNRLKFEISSGSNRTLFDHSTKNSVHPLEPAEAAIYLITAQTFSLAANFSSKGTIGDSFILNHPGYKQSPAVAGINVWIQGRSISETLILNLVDSAKFDDDTAAWEQESPELLHNIDFQTGFADLYTWQIRYISLQALESEGRLMVEPVIKYVQGRMPGGNYDDPMKCHYYKNKKEGMKLVYYNVNKATWRNAHALFGSGKNAQPATFSSMSRLLVDGIVDTSDIYKINVAGILNDQGKVIKRHHDRMPTPASLFNDIYLQNLVESAIGDATEMASMLQQRMWSLCRFYYSKAQSSPDKDDIAKLVDKLDARSHYWSTLERHFYKFLFDLPEKREAARKHWREIVKKTAQTTFNKTKQLLGQSVRAIIARANVSDYFRFETEPDEN